MRFEPPLDRAQLMAAVRDAYGIPATDLTFMPVGLGSACYDLRAGRDERYFLKVWPHLRLGEPAATRQYATLILTRTLHDRGIGVRVPYPIPTRDGTLWAELARTPFGIFPLLPGTAPTFGPVALSEELGRTIAAYHQATPLLADVLPPHETFAVAYKPELQHNLMIAAAIGPAARPGLQAARAWVLGRQDDILTQLMRLHDLQAIVRGLGGPLVLCHTDMHRENLLVDDQGQISILDWDDAKMAPPEHDLRAGLAEGHAGEGFTAFLRTYRQVTSGVPLHLAHFRFYLLRHYVEDMAICLRNLLAPDAHEQEDTAQLYGMEVWGARGWDRLDATLAMVAAALRSTGR